jgi:hypothetical protein
MGCFGSKPELALQLPWGTGGEAVLVASKKHQVCSNVWHCASVDIGCVAPYEMCVKCTLQRSCWLSLCQIQSRLTLLFWERHLKNSSNLMAVTWVIWKENSGDFYTDCGTRWRSCLRHCATSRKFAGSIPDGVIGNFHWQNPSGLTVALRSTQPLKEMVSGIFPGG